MSLRKGSIAALAIFIVALVIVRIQQSETLYTFGHQEYVDVAIFTLLIMLAITHALLAALMFAQSNRWQQSDAAMFRFIAVKTVFWANASTKYFLGITKGVTLDSILMFAALLIFTVDLDVRLIGRYILGWEDDSMYQHDSKEEE